jgi:hypothetical protein
MDKKEKEQFTDTVWFVVAIHAVGQLNLIAIYGVFVK